MLLLQLMLWVLRRMGRELWHRRHRVFLLLLLLLRLLLLLQLLLLLLLPFTLVCLPPLVAIEDPHQHDGRVVILLRQLGVLPRLFHKPVHGFLPCEVWRQGRI